MPAAPRDDLFTRLINHRVSDEHARREDFLTECFAWVIQHDAELLSRLLAPDGPVFSASQGAAPQSGPLLVETQVTLGDLGRPDMRISDGRGFTLLVESKVDAAFDADQIRRYLLHTHGLERGFVLALLPRRSVPATLPAHPQFVGATTWEAVAALVSVLPVTDDGHGLFRAALLRLLREYGLADSPREVLEWEAADGTQRVDEVLAVCSRLTGVVQGTAADDALMRRAPAFYRPVNGRWQLGCSRGSPFRVGFGPSPRPVIAHQMAIWPATGAFGSLMATVGFRGYARGGGRRPAALTLTYCTQRIVTTFHDTEPAFLAALLARGAGSPVGPELNLHERAGSLLASCHRRITAMMGRVRHALAAAGYEPGPVEQDEWGIGFALLPTHELLGNPVDTDLLALRYRDVLRASIEAFMEEDPGEPLARLFAEAAMPAFGGFGERGGRA